MPASVKGAVCLIKLDNQIVLIDELLTKRLSLPGGTIISSEDPAWTAERETWEEAGLAVTAQYLIAHDGKAAYYYCTPVSPAYAYQNINRFGGHSLPVNTAEHFGRETQDALIINPQKVKADEYRYPDKWSQIVAWFTPLPTATVFYMENTVSKASKLHQTELSQWRFDVYHSDIRMIAAYVAAIISLPLWLVLLIPSALSKFGASHTLKLIYACTIASLIGLVAQFGFTAAPPWTYFGITPHVPSQGYQMPSVIMAVMTALAIMLAQIKSWSWLNINVLGMVFIILGYFTASVVAGNFFLIDGFAGIALGALVAWHIHKLERASETPFATVLASWEVWFVLMLATFVANYFWLSPNFIVWGGVLFVLTVTAPFLRCYVGLTDFTEELETGTTHFTTRHLWAIALLNAAVFSLLTLLSYSVGYAGYLGFALESARYPLLLVITALLVYRTVIRR
ncbi:NUDIX domain-containing protein [Vibrio sp. SM6]|uniref:NUDIX domain-containing protein n=1 Tax=Vibrio agarilyticus TaxID=2726741 RepID=A0A7X8TPT9_9VIBR|nr:NUDIX domain-containing protein [Vibrio agarilyticus]NLS12606.1 NUDIX domain-containing protein [Vibrio agarilyticus]